MEYDVSKSISRREMKKCSKINILYARIAEMNFCSQHQNRNSTRKKVLKMNQAAAPHAEKRANNSVMDMVLAPEKTGLCLRRFVRLVGKRRRCRLNRPVIDQSIAGIASRPGGTAVTDKQGKIKQGKHLHSKAVDHSGQQLF